MNLRIIVLLSLLISSAASVYADDIKLPNIGAASGSRYSADEEKELGAAFMRRLRLQIPISQDPEVEDYILDLGHRLVSNSEYRHSPFHFFVVNQNQINAFAGPGGYIGVNAGLIIATETESELAAVVAHETAHVTQRHLDRAMNAAEKLSIPTTAALIAAIILGGQDINIAEAALAATIAANIQTQLNFTRKHEQEADHVGMQILAAANFDPHAMPSFFERLQQNERLYGDQIPEFLRTHPVNTTRIAESKSRATQYKTPSVENSFRYYLVKNKLRVLNSDNPQTLTQHYEAELKAGNYQNKLGHQYGYAYALLKASKNDEAKKVVHQLIKNDKERIPYLILLAETEFALGNTDEALEVYEEALKLSPNNRAVSQHYASTLLQSGQPEKAKQILAPLLNAESQPLLYELMAKAEGETGHPGAALRMLAEFYFLYGQTNTAIDQLSLALRQKDIDSTTASRIEKRLQELKEIALLERQF